MALAHSAPAGIAASKVDASKVQTVDGAADRAIDRELSRLLRPHRLQLRLPQPKPPRHRLPNPTRPRALSQTLARATGVKQHGPVHADREETPGLLRARRGSAGR